MSDEKALIPVEEKLVDFYGDDLTAALVSVGDDQVVYVPLRPICDYLGIDWASQYKRLQRDPGLWEQIRSVVITTTEASKRSPFVSR